ncbi:MAG TPA: hypothetical protein VFB06_22370 [Streptosporangiaceae bacterium]|nr:hypothetical protein [Streptosporangiaceae bacterium]
MRPLFPLAKAKTKRARRGAGGLLAQAAAGPGFWEDLLGELRRAGLIAELLADGRSRRRCRRPGTGTSWTGR